MSTKGITLLAGVKGAIMAAIILLIADTGFVQGLLVAVCSAAVSGVFLLIATHMSLKKAETQTEKAKQEIKAAIEQQGTEVNGS